MRPDARHNPPKRDEWVAQTLHYLREYVAQHGCAPTVREMSEALGLSGPSGAKWRLDVLEGLKLIELGPLVAARDVTLTAQAWRLIREEA
jgi:SOS-response transcriptional repressor LexA